LHADPTKKFSRQFKSRRSADKMRLQFYAFRNAARKGGEIGEYPALDSIEVVIDANHVLTFQCKDYSEVAEALNEMLRAQGVVPSTDPLPTKKTS
jgi:hypothetical protein